MEHSTRRCQAKKRKNAFCVWHRKMKSSKWKLLKKNDKLTKWSEKSNKWQKSSWREEESRRSAPRWSHRKMWGAHWRKQSGYRNRAPGKSPTICVITTMAKATHSTKCTSTRQAIQALCPTRTQGRLRSNLANHIYNPACVQYVAVYVHIMHCIMLFVAFKFIIYKNTRQKWHTLLFSGSNVLELEN